MERPLEPTLMSWVEVAGMPVVAVLLVEEDDEEEDESSARTLRRKMLEAMRMDRVRMFAESGLIWSDGRLVL